MIAFLKKFSGGIIPLLIIAMIFGSIILVKVRRDATKAAWHEAELQAERDARRVEDGLRSVTSEIERDHDQIENDHRRAGPDGLGDSLRTGTFLIDPGAGEAATSGAGAIATGQRVQPAKAD